MEGWGEIAVSDSFPWMLVNPRHRVSSLRERENLLQDGVQDLYKRPEIPANTPVPAIAVSVT